MRHGTGFLVLLAMVSGPAFPGCGTEGGQNGDAWGPAEATFTVLTYNVAGLPEGISKSHPEINTVQISPLLNGYDIALVQEDFWYHAELSSLAEHPFQSEPWNTELDWTDMGDGLNRFSLWPFQEFQRVPWPGCNGTFDCSGDCLANKGFSVARHRLAEGVDVDFYNLHMEAGHCPEDFAIRADSIQLLLDVLAERSGDVPVVMAGDFNLHADDPVELVQLERLVLEGGLSDACWTLQCGNTTIDRIFFRGSADIGLDVDEWSKPPEFKDPEGEKLSDHKPTAAVLTWHRL